MGKNSIKLLNFVKTLPLFLILGITLAQTTEEIINTIISVGIIVAVVMILLYLGGVWKPGQGKLRIPWGLIIYIILIVVIFVLPLLQRLGRIKIFPDTLDEAFQANPSFAQSYQNSFMMRRMPDSICNIFKYLAVDERVACYMPAFLYFFLLPFVAIYAITWGFLTQIEIFGDEKTRRLNPVLAFIIAFMTLPMGIFLILLAFWFSVLGGFSVAIFVAMFLAGVFLRGYGFTVTRYYEETKKFYSEKLKREARDLAQRLGRIAARVNTFTTWQELENEIGELRRMYPDYIHILNPITANVQLNQTINSQDALNRINQAIQQLNQIATG